MENAAKPTFTGIVVKGEGFAGPELDVPTANLELHPRPKLHYGIYAARVKHGKDDYNGIVYYGSTTREGANQEPKFEVHLFDFDGDLIGEKLMVTIVELVGEFVPWESKERMRQKIRSDIDTARQVLG